MSWPREFPNGAPRVTVIGADVEPRERWEGPELVSIPIGGARPLCTMWPVVVYRCDGGPLRGLTVELPTPQGAEGFRLKEDGDGSNRYAQYVISSPGVLFFWGWWKP